MEMKATTSRLLMSDALRGQVPELEGEEAQALEEGAVTVSAMLQFGEKKTAVVGILRSVLFEKEPELEFRVTVSDALDIVSASNMSFLGFTLHHGKREVQVPGPFVIKGARIDDLDLTSQLCLLALGLKRPERAA